MQVGFHQTWIIAQDGRRPDQRPVWSVVKIRLKPSTLTMISWSEITEFRFSCFLRLFSDHLPTHTLIAHGSVCVLLGSTGPVGIVVANTQQSKVSGATASLEEPTCLFFFHCWVFTFQLIKSALRTIPSICARASTLMKERARKGSHNLHKGLRSP